MKLPTQMDWLTLFAIIIMAIIIITIWITCHKISKEVQNRILELNSEIDKLKLEGKRK